MPNKAHVILRGTVMQEPKSSLTSTGKTWLKINLAVQTTKKQEGSQWPASDFYNVNVYGTQAEGLMGKIVAKSKLLVIGDMYMGEPYTTREGKTTISPIVNATEIEITSGGNFTRNSNTAKAAAAEINPEVDPF